MDSLEENGGVMDRVRAGYCNGSLEWAHGDVETASVSARWTAEDPVNFPKLAGVRTSPATPDPEDKRLNINLVELTSTVGV